MSDKKRNDIITPKFRVSFEHLLVPDQKKKDDGTVKATYEVTMLFEKSADLKVLRDAANQALQEYFAKKGLDETKRKAFLATMRSPFRDGDLMTYDGFPGHTFVRASSTTAPGVVDKYVKKIINAAEVYSGMYAIAQIRAYVYENMGNRGVTFELLNVQKVADGEKFAGRPSADTAFTPLEQPVDPIPGTTDECPF